MGLVQKAFSDIITFSRSSNATRVGPTGRVEYAPHNLILQSQTFDNASWTKSGATVTANAIAAPDGTVTAEKVIESATTANHGIYQVATVVANVPHTFSVYAKAGERSWLAVNPYTTGSSFVYFDLANGAVGTVGSGITASIQSVGNGWYRCVATRTPTTTNFEPNVQTSTGNGTSSYAGDGTSGIYLWGAQLSVGPYPLDYTPTTSAAVYGPRFDYDPVTLAARGLLVEEQRTNACTYSEDIGNAVWNPTNATVATNTATSPDGTADADAVTFTASNGKLIRTNPTGWISVSGSTTYTISVWLKVTSGTFKLRLSRTNTSTWATAEISPELTVTTDWQRFTLTYTSGAGDTLTDIVIGAEDKTPYTLPAIGTVLVWGVQHEQGSFATSYIPTIASTVTRSADVASVNTLSPWWNASAATFYIENSFGSHGNQPIALSDQSGVGNAWVYSAAGIISSYIVGPGLNLSSGVTVSINTTVKSAFAYSSSGKSISVNGSVPVVSGNTTAPTASTQLSLGGWPGGSYYINGHIRRVAYYPRALSSAELSALTA